MVDRRSKIVCGCLGLFFLLLRCWIHLTFLASSRAFLVKGFFSGGVHGRPNVSRYLFYGNTTRRFSLVDILGDYFEGPAPVYAHGNVSIDQNCLHNTSGCINLACDDLGTVNSTEPPPDAYKSGHTVSIVFAVSVVAILIILVVCSACQPP